MGDDMRLDDEFEAQALALAERLSDMAAKTPTEVLDHEYMPIQHGPLMADMLREQVGVKLSENGKFLDICADETVRDGLVSQIQASGIESMLGERPAQAPATAMQRVVQAVLVSARLSMERSEHALLTTTEVDILATAMTTLYGRALHSMLRNSHPGPVQGSA